MSLCAMGQATQRKTPSRPTLPAPAEQEVRVINARRAPFRDFYHRFLRMPWWAELGVIVLAFLLLNAAFAALYLWTGGVANARPGSFVDVFYFSVQTMGTIGYGAMYLLSPGANALMVAEAVMGLIVTARIHVDARPEADEPSRQRAV
jgi:inward rectifier potassium channel